MYVHVRISIKSSKYFRTKKNGKKARRKKHTQANQTKTKIKMTSFRQFEMVKIQSQMNQMQKYTNKNMSKKIEEYYNDQDDDGEDEETEGERK